MDGSELQWTAWWEPALASVALVVVSGVCSWAEAAILALVRALRLRRHKTEELRGRMLRRLLEHSEQTLLTTQMASAALNVGAALLAAEAAARLWPSHRAIAIWIGIVLAGAALLAFGEALPRALAAGRSEKSIRRAARRAARLIGPVVFLSAPLRWPLAWIASRLVPAPATDAVKDPPKSIEDIRALLSSLEAARLLEEEEREMIDGVFEFAETTADEIMTPRTDIEAYPLATPQEEMIERLKRTQFARVLVYEDTIDNVVGILPAKKTLLDPQRPWREFLQKPLMVPATLELDDLLIHFKRAQSHLAVVLDEYGGVAGIVTIHDLMQEIVGEIPEEEEGGEQEMELVEPGVYLVAGRMGVSGCAERLGCPLPEEGARTIAGLVFTRLGRVPRLGEEVRIGRVFIRVLELLENRIERLEIRLALAEPGPDGKERGEKGLRQDESGIPDLLEPVREVAHE